MREPSFIELQELHSQQGSSVPYTQYRCFTACHQLLHVPCSITPEQSRVPEHMTFSLSLSWPALGYTDGQGLISSNINTYKVVNSSSLPDLPQGKMYHYSPHTFYGSTAGVRRAALALLPATHTAQLWDSRTQQLPPPVAQEPQAHPD